MPAFQGFLALVADDYSLESVEEMAKILLETPSFESAVAHLQRDPAAAAMIAERYMAPPHDLNALLDCPPDSLGYLYAKEMKAKGLKAEDLYIQISIVSDASYVEARLSQTHDIWHLVTGFDVSEMGEVSLQAFHLPQFPYPLAVTLLSSSLMATLLFQSYELPQLLEALRQGWEMGHVAKPLFAQRWEEGWDKPLATWREELNIQAIPAAIAS
ncbi:MAG: Coq4 family protein [Cyanobacteria bacterium J06638_22]